MTTIDALYKSAPKQRLPTKYSNSVEIDFPADLESIYGIELANILPYELGIITLIYVYLDGNQKRILWPVWPPAPLFSPIKPASDDLFWSKLTAIFVHIPKTGGNSLKYVNGYSENLRLGIFAHLKAIQFPPSVQNKLYALVRNPYDRAVSSFYFHKSGGFGLTPDLTRDLNTKYPTFESYVLNVLDKGKLNSISEVPQWE